MKISRRQIVIYSIVALVGVTLGLVLPSKPVRDFVEAKIHGKTELLFPRDFTQAAVKINQSVVGIVVTKIKKIDINAQEEIYYKDFLEINGIPQILEKTVHNMGSGIVLTEQGHIITSNHIVKNAKELQVAFSSGVTTTASIIASDSLNDIAIIQIHSIPEDIKPAQFVSRDGLKVGEFVLAVGNPYLNFFNSADPTMTLGIVSALHRNFRFGEGMIYQDMIQTDASINPGNSGGALITPRGNVAGLISFIYTGNETSSGSVGIGFAIPGYRAFRIGHELITHGRRRTCWTGLKIKESEEATISAIIVGGPGDRAGIMAGDILTRIGDRKIEYSSDLIGVFLPNIPGDTVNISYMRNGSLRKTRLILQEAPSR